MQTVDARTLEKMLKETPDLRVLDVRTPAEYQTAHIPGSFNLSLDQLPEHVESLSGVVHPVVLVCRSGSRARQAGDMLARTGKANVQLLEGGLLAWEESKLPVRRGQKQAVSLERQVRIVAGLMAAVGGVLSVFVNPWFGLVPTFVGAGLVNAGITDKCPMALLLARLPYNRRGAQDCCTVVAALSKS